jgi:hypothetical protein
MRKQTTVLLMLLILSGVIAVLHFLPQPPPVTDFSRTPDEPKMPMSEAPFSRNFLQTEPLAGLPGFSSHQESLSEKLVNKTLPKLLANKEGSYTNLTDLLTTGEPRKLDLNSNWMATHLFPSRTLPLMSMRVTQDPDTGEYRISGGSLAVPGTGLEAGYETELNSNERKATLQWKKSF